MGLYWTSGIGRDEKVATIIIDGEWQWPDSDFPGIIFLKNSIPGDMVPHPDQEDTTTWGPSGGTFSVSSAWKALRMHKPSVIWHNIV